MKNKDKIYLDYYNERSKCLNCLLFTMFDSEIVCAYHKEKGKQLLIALEGKIAV